MSEQPIKKGKEIQQLVSEKAERTFTIILQTGGTRLTWLRRIEKVRKHYALSTGTHNPGVVMRKLLGFGTALLLHAFHAGLKRLPYLYYPLWIDFVTDIKLVGQLESEENLKCAFVKKFSITKRSDCKKSLMQRGASRSITHPRTPSCLTKLSLTISAIGCVIPRKMLDTNREPNTTRGKSALKTVLTFSEKVIRRKLKTVAVGSLTVKSSGFSSQASGSEPSAIDASRSDQRPKLRLGAFC